MGVARLAQDLQVSRPTMSACVKTLVDRGLLKRSAETHDARSHSLILSAQGRKVHLAISASAGLDRSIAVMREPEREALLLGLMTVLQQLLTDGSVDVQRMCWTCSHYRGDRRNTHRCALMEISLATKDLRTDCPEHELVVA
ncbi:MAG: winged helix-turn-helix transcriptional regulator [Flavobacteriales bacterium]|nr:winged helix-turn-helix transcriptional regulator [Flavobacteriales bacterium]